MSDGSFIHMQNYDQCQFNEANIHQRSPGVFVYFLAWIMLFLYMCFSGMLVPYVPNRFPFPVDCQNNEGECIFLEMPGTMKPLA